jgi:hypothetical protein
MMRAWGCVAVAAMASALVACPLKKPGATDGGEDGSAEASAAAAPEAGPAEAINASEMTRYPDEKPIDHAPLTAEAGGNMRTLAGAGGDLVMVLKRGTEVAKLAEHGNYYLVLADDPKDPSKKLMGWVAESAFNGEAPHKGQSEVTGADGGAHVVDAGAKPSVDAGTKPGPLRILDIHKSADGSCASGYAPCSALCRATCKTVSDCGPLPLVTCTGGFCLGPGAQPCK